MHENGVIKYDIKINLERMDGPHLTNYFVNVHFSPILILRPFNLQSNDQHNPSKNILIG